MGIPGGAGRHTHAAVDPTEYRCYIKEGYPPIMQQRVQIFHRRSQATFVRRTTPHHGDTSRGISYSVTAIIQHLSAIVNSNFFGSQISILYYRKKCKSAHLHHTAETTHWRGNAPLAASRRTPHQSSIGSEEPMDDSFSPGRSLVPYPTRFLETIHGANSHQRLLP